MKFQNERLQLVEISWTSKLEKDEAEEKIQLIEELDRTKKKKTLQDWENWQAICKNGRDKSKIKKQHKWWAWEMTGRWNQLWMEN